VRGNLRQLPNEVYCEGGRDGRDMWHDWGIKGIPFFFFNLNGGITMCLDTYYDIIIVRQHNCLHYTR